MFGVQALILSMLCWPRHLRSLRGPPQVIVVTRSVDTQTCHDSKGLFAGAAVVFEIPANIGNSSLLLGPGATLRLRGGDVSLTNCVVCVLEVTTDFYGSFCPDSMLFWGDLQLD